MFYPEKELDERRDGSDNPNDHVENGSALEL